MTKPRVVLITGASRGIGRATARRFAAEGADLVLVARSLAALEPVLSECQGALGIAADLSTRDAPAEIVRQALARFGRIDVLVNNAGAIPAGDFLTLTDDQWEQGFALKLHGYIRLSRAVFPVMRDGGGGRIVNVIGTTARNPQPSYMAGGVANAGLINFTKGLSDLGAPHGILVTAVSPSAVATDRIEQQFRQIAETSGRSVEDVRAERMAMQPLGRMASADDVANSIAFLASDEAGFLNGICITVDGGSTRGVWL